MPGNLFTADIPYRLLGANKPTLSCTPDGFITAAPQSEDFHCSCLEFDGIGDAARLPTDQDLGLGNMWSVMLWVVPRDLDPVGTKTLFEIHNLASPGDDSNAFCIDILPGGTIQFRMFNNSGVLIKRFDMDSLESDTSGIDGFFFSAEEWCQIFVTWDGTDLTIYRNGYNITPDMTTITDVAGSQANTNRSLSIGATVEQTGFFKGFVHSVATWSAVLSQSAARTLWNQGAGAASNLFQGYDDYLDPNLLESWYQLGKVDGDPVRDSTSNARHLTAS